MKFIKYISNGNTVGLENSIESYWELNKEGYIVRSIDMIENGDVLKYSEDHVADSYGQLPEGVITEDNLKDKRFGTCVYISMSEFDKLWSKKSINYDNKSGNQSDVNIQTQIDFHGYVNLAIIAFLLIGSGIALWYLISQIWIWLVIFPIWALILILISHRLIPKLTYKAVERNFKDKWEPVFHIPFKIEEPWELIDDGKAFVSELKKEVGSDHKLYGLEFVAVAKRVDCDDHLFYTSDSTLPIAVVHLTWSGKVERDPSWPKCDQYTSWEQWRIKRMNVDSRNYSE